MRSLLLLLLLGLTACAKEVVDDPRLGQMVYIDTATDKPLVANIARETPALHPETGDRTLVPALHCDACQTWRPSPPLEVLQRNPEAARCPKCKGPLKMDGPWPTDAK